MMTGFTFLEKEKRKKSAIKTNSLAKAKKHFVQMRSLFFKEVNNINYCL